jgi:formylglycine-generating enzyme required for sulfatase activity
LPYGQGGDAVDALLDHPVVQVSWYDADAFCKWRGFGLPTEAQWEKAARGVDGRTFPWGDAFDAGKANFCDTSCPLTDRVHTTESDGYARTSPVDAFPAGASPYGALNMAGNVWEWTRDWYDHEYYEYASEVDPLGPDQAASRDGRKVVHGGAWTSEAEKLRAASRSFDDPREWRAFGVGFRCAVTATVDELER